MPSPVRADRRSGDRREGGRRISRLLKVRGLTVTDLNPLDRSDQPGEVFERQWRRGVQFRTGVVLVALGLWGVVLQARLVKLQILDHTALLEQAERQQQDSLTLEPDRGSIVDRHGRLLAYSVDAESIGVHPKLVVDPTETTAAVCGALGDCTAEERARLLRTLKARGRPTYIRRARAVAPEQVERVKALKLPGIQIQHDTRRFYPSRDLAAHVLGYVNVDNKGLGGIEYTFDGVMRGREGRALVLVDAKGARIDTLVQSDPVPGATLELTLDLEKQAMVERELRAGVIDAGAKAGSAIVMETRTGALIALASYPTFNPNQAWLANSDAQRNRATQDIYEPGSTFKIITAAAALGEHVVQPNEIIDTGAGSMTLSGRRTIRDTSPHGAISFEDVIVTSSNVGTVKVGLRLGADRLAGYVHRFGFGQRPTRDLAGAVEGLWNPRGLDENGLASLSIGYQIAVTPLQMVTAVNAVANGGVLVEPLILRAIVRGGQREAIASRVVRRAIDPAIAATLTAMLEGVVDRGTAKLAAVPGFMAAGKTGTTEKLTEHGYSETETTASFVGYVPSRRPEYTILVVVDSPQRGRQFGGVASAPVFRRIAENLMLRDGIVPTTHPEPPIVVRDKESLPAPSQSRVAALLPATVTTGGPALMPDVVGLSAREAVGVLQQAGLHVRVSGSGLVMRQTPLPGAAIEPGAWSSLEFSRRSTAPAAEGTP